MVWNVGIGTTASFVPTMTRLILERIKDLYGPHDHIIQVKVPPTAAASTINHLVALEVFMAIAGSLNITSLGPELQELKQLAADESYYGYGMVSEDLMLRAWGRQYIIYYGRQDPWSVKYDPSYGHRPYVSPIRKRILEASAQGKRYLLVVEDLHAPVSLDVLAFILAKEPSLVHNNRWLISSTSKQVCDQSKSPRTAGALNPELPAYEAYHVEDGHYHAVPRGDLDKQDWSALISEALQDAAGSILRKIQHDQGIHHHPLHGDHKFWLRLAHHCLYYGILYHPLGGAAESYPVSPDELVRCWVAEDLIFPGTSIPSSVAKKQSKYRSAYEAAKVVIQALQEYSLLPSSDSAPNTSSTSRTVATASASSQDAAVVTGVSMLAMGVPRLKQDDLLVPHNKKWVSFMEGDGRHVSWDWRREFIPGEKIMTTLILRCYAAISGFPFQQVLNSHLRVLDLSYTMIESLPSSISHLWNLHLLSLRGCSQLETLSQPSPPTSEQKNPYPLSHLGNLEVLDLNGAPLLELTQHDGSNKSNLHYLDLSGSKVATLPPEFFRQMSSLEELILGNCSNLKELPPSMAEMSSLLILHVEGTRITSFAEGMFEAMQRLHTLKLINNMLLISLPRSLSKAKGLKEIHIYNCIGLKLDFLWELVPCLEDLYIQCWEALEDIKIEGHPNLRMFSLSGPSIRYLSLRWCRRLKIVNFSDDLTDLEDVDLSATDLEELPHNLPNLPNLRKLLLLNVPCFKRFPWHKLVRFPKVFYLDNCSGDDNQFPDMLCQQETDADENQHAEKTTNTAQINVNDSRIFHSFNTDAAHKLVNEGQFLQSFSVQVKSCSVKGNKTQDIERELCTRMQSQTPYFDVHCSEADSIMPMMMLHPRQRHVEISAKNRYPHALRHLLSVANSIFIIDDDFVGCLTDLNHGLMCLEECHLQNCHQMAVVLHLRSSTYIVDTGHKILEDLELPLLRILQISNSNNLLSLVEPSGPSDLGYSELITLRLLKHIHLEHCPRLEKLFPHSLSLPALETLVILFCPNLKTIFYTGPGYKIAPSPLPNIERIYFQELPQLLHIRDHVMFRFEMPKWEKLFVRGCRSFQHLPLLKKEYPKSKVEVSGECDWWGRLQLRLPEQSEYYLHVPPPEFASRKKYIIRSYLR